MRLLPALALSASLALGACQTPDGQTDWGSTAASHPTRKAHPRSRQAVRRRREAGSAAEACRQPRGPENALNVCNV